MVLGMDGQHFIYHVSLTHVCFLSLLVRMKKYIIRRRDDFLSSKLLYDMKSKSIYEQYCKNLNEGPLDRSEVLSLVPANAHKLTTVVTNIPLARMHCYIIACLSQPPRAFTAISRGNEGRGASMPILEESARRKGKTLEVLKCRDSDTKADKISSFLPMHGYRIGHTLF